jgi:putative toxin-antitoxin system antitoxin component (TIGR02293 family)
MTDTVELLGKSSFHSKRIQDDTDLYEEIETGIKSSALIQFAKHTGLSEDCISALIPINKKTLLRRKAQGALDSKQSDRLIMIAKVCAHALNVFGSKEKTKAWLKTPNVALSNKKPIDMLKNSLGCSLLDEVLYRIEYGIYT